MDVGESDASGGCEGHPGGALWPEGLIDYGGGRVSLVLRFLIRLSTVAEGYWECDRAADERTIAVY